MELGCRGCDFDLQRGYEESQQLLGTVHGIKAGGLQRERWKGTTSTVHLVVQEPSERGQDGWRLEEGGR